MEELARRQGVESTVHFLGLRQDVDRIWRAADVFTLTVSAKPRR